MIHYLSDDFTEKFIEHIKHPDSVKSPYVDIDGVYYGKLACPAFYSDLTYYLNAKMGEEKFFKPDAEEASPSDRTITFKTEDKQGLYLTSDTFGFSAANLRGERKGVYPYANLLKADVNNAGFIAESVYSTRVLGGSFIWPKVNIGGRWKSLYNYYRGAGSLIEDRADLTLYEIKCFYDVFNSLTDEKKGME